MIRINLLPVREARRQATLRRHGIMIGAAVGLALVLCVVTQFSINSTISSRQQMLVQKKAELKKLEATQKEVRRFEKERQAIEAKLNVIAQIEKARTGPVRMMDAIATQLPKRVWLTQLNAKAGQLSMEGRSLDAEIVADFLTALLATPVIETLELQSTELVEASGLKVNAFKFKGSYPHPKPPTAGDKGKKRKRGRRR